VETNQLTPCELKIMSLLKDERAMFSSKELARTLGKSPKTVNNQLNAIYRKLSIDGICKKIKLIKLSQSLLI